MTRMTKQRKASSSDKTTYYARAVVDGKIIAGPHVRSACKRHLADLSRDDVVFDRMAAERVFKFFETILRLNGGQFEGEPFKLLPFQCFILGSLFGWKRKDGLRRFRAAFIEMGKGNGKSPLAAGVGLYMLMADGEPRAEVYSAAVNRDQAKILFRDALAMRSQSREIAARTSVVGGVNPYRIAYHRTGSWFEPLSTETTGKGKSGIRPHCDLQDEIHEHKSSAMIEFVGAGQKWRRQPLSIRITNSGFDKTTVCWEQHEYGVKVAAGDLVDDTFFSYICALDDKDNPFRSEDCWIKVNPALDVIVPRDYLRRQVREAKGMPSKESVVRRLNFCEWTQSFESWIGAQEWHRVEADITDDDLIGRPCYGGIDLGSKLDMSAWALAFPFAPGDHKLLPHGGIIARVWFWTPGDTMRERSERDRAHYPEWAAAGFLEAPAGVTIDFRWVAQKVAKACADYDFRICGFDRYRIDDFVRALDEEGVDCALVKNSDAEGAGKKIEKQIGRLVMVDHGQGFKSMGPAVDGIEQEMLMGRLRVQKNPVMRWNVASVGVEIDPAGSRKFSKRKSTGRIDGLIALVMAVNMARLHGDKGSVYEREHLLVI